jgi:hypothetical protein
VEGTTKVKSNENYSMNEASVSGSKIQNLNSENSLDSLDLQEIF